MNRSLLRVIPQYILSLAAQTNAIPLPSVSEVFGVRLPPPSHCLTAVDFDIIPNKPPPSAQQYDEEIEEVEEEESEVEEEDVKPFFGNASRTQYQGQKNHVLQRLDDAAPISAMQSPFDADMASPSDGVAADEGSDAGGAEEEGLFAGGDDESDADDAMENVDVPSAVNGVKRKLVEEDDYD